jgi:methionyl-tRNA synthetase
VGAKYDSKVPDPKGYSTDYLVEHEKAVNELLATYLDHLENVKLKAGLADAMHISALGNKLLQDNKLDNRLLAEEPDRCAAVINMALNHIYLLGSTIAPYMPETARNIFKQLGLDPKPAIPDKFDTSKITPGHAIGASAYLFSQIKPEKEQEWRDAFGGEEARKAKEEAAAKAAAKKAQKEKDKAKKAAKKAAAAAAAAGGTGVESAEKKQEADPAVEKVTEALSKADVHTS